MSETIGKRIATLRQQKGWTQQALAERLAISRVAVSHIEMDLSVPGERTIALLAGLFKMTPHQLVEGTTYPAAKAERLPAVTCCYTALELELAVLENDLRWLSKLKSLANWQNYARQVEAHWRARLQAWENEIGDEQERELLQRGWQALKEITLPP